MTSAGDVVPIVIDSILIALAAAFFVSPAVRGVSQAPVLRLSQRPRSPPLRGLTGFRSDHPVGRRFYVWRVPL